MLSKYKYFSFFVILLLSACAGIPSFTPETPREGIAAAHLLIKELAVKAGKAYGQQLISEDRKNSIAADLQEALDDVKKAENAIRLFEQTEDPAAEAEANSRLDKAQSILSILETLLEASQ